MGHLVGAAGALVNFTIYPGAPVRWAYWWDSEPLGNGAWLVAAYPPSIATHSNPVMILANGLRSTPTLAYYVDLQCNDEYGTGSGASFRLFIGQLQ